MDLIRKYFPELGQLQISQFESLLQIIPIVNEKINVISRKDVGFLEERHLLHSLSISKIFRFENAESVIDAGTGGGFPGVPLAIMFPDVRFILVDSVGKKIRLVNEVAHKLELKNISAVWTRLENLDSKADFVVSRAVTSFPNLYRLCSGLIRKGGNCQFPNGLISLKGGDLRAELGPFWNQVKVFSISDWFEESFFLAKKIVFLKI